MIYTFLSDIRKMKDLVKGGVENIDGLLSNRAPESVKKYVAETNNISVKIEKIGAYNTLISALGLFFGSANFEIERTEYGKPKLLNPDGSFSGIYMNISHCKNLCAVTLSDESEVGVDVQDTVNKDRAQRLEKRFFDGIKLPRKYPEIEYMMYFSDKNGVMHYADLPELLCVTDKYFIGDFSAKWVLGEAALKCDGRGFSAVADIEKMLAERKAEIIKIKIGNDIYRVATVI